MHRGVVIAALAAAAGLLLPGNIAAQSATTKAKAAPAGAASPRVSQPFGRRSRPPQSNPRIGSIKNGTLIFAKPIRTKQHVAIGTIRIGTTVKLKSAKPVSGNQWYAVEPFGYVFADNTTTFDFESTYWRALSQLKPKPGPWPFQYAWSTGAPMYARLPTAAEQRSCELRMGPRGNKRNFKTLGKWSKSHEVLLKNGKNDAIAATHPKPSYFRGHQHIEGSPWAKSTNPKVHTVPAGSGVAYVKSFRANGRVWLLTPDLLLIPADRVYAYRRSPFKGIELAGETSLPLAWVRGKRAVGYKPNAKGAFDETNSSWKRHQHVLLSGKSRKRRGVRYWQTRKGEQWLREGAAVSVVQQVKNLKWM